MKFKVNENCIGCGLCANICAEVFTMSEDGTAVAIDEEVFDEELSNALEALNSCPVSAIEEK